MDRAESTEQATLPRSRWPEIVRGLLDSPVLARELRTRMRGTRAYWVLTGYLLLLSLVLFIAYFNWYQNAQLRSYPYYGYGSASFVIGRNFFAWLSTTQAVLICLITPALTSGAITIEREQRTYEMLAITTLSPKAIILGKLVASVSYIIILLISSLPLISICFMLGGVAPSEILAVYAILFLTAFLCGSIGIFWSTILRTTSFATILSYLSVFVLMPLVIAYARYPVAQAPFYNTHFPVWVSFIVLAAAYACLIITIAITHLEHFEVDKSRSIRLQAAGCFFLSLVPYVGVMYATSATGGHSSLYEAFCYPVVGASLALPLLALPVFGTGEIRPKRKSAVISLILSGLIPRQWLAGNPASGLPYVMLCFLVALAWSRLSLGFTQVGAGAAVKTSALLKIGAIGFVCLAAYGALGIFFSLITRRYYAMLATYAVLLLLVLAPLVILAPLVMRPWNSPASSDQAAGWEEHLLCFNPFLAVYSAAQPAEFAKWMPRLRIPLPFWQFTLVLYGLLAAGGWMACSIAGSALARPQEEAKTELPPLEVSP